VSGDHPNLEWLRKRLPDFRIEAWKAALSELGAGDGALAAKLADAFPRERDARHLLYEDAIDTLDELSGANRMAIVTNGPPELQRQKIDATGIEKYFHAVITSIELGVGKPERGIFDAALAALDSTPERTAMVGDSLSRDVAGAREAGIFSVWLDRSGSGNTIEIEPDATIASLRELRSVLD
jgi:putative hydrolase of the HAD superfamily